MKSKVWKGCLVCLFLMLPLQNAYAYGMWEFGKLSELSAVFVFYFILIGWAVSAVLLTVIPILLYIVKPKSFKRVTLYLYGGHILVFLFLLIDWVI